MYATQFCTKFTNYELQTSLSPHSTKKPFAMFDLQDVLLCLFLFLGTSAVPGALYDSYSNNCDAIRNGTAKIVSDHNYYQCFPYVLDLVQPSDVWVGETYYDILSTEPPPGDLHFITELNVDETSVDRFDDDEARFTFKLSWADARLEWDPDKWHFRKYPVSLNPGQQIWAPQLSLKGAQRQANALDHFVWFDSKLYFDGKVSARASSRSELSRCESSSESFPYDRSKCCLDISFKPLSHVLVNLTENAITYPKGQSNGWSLQEVHVRVSSNEDEHLLTLCINIARNAEFALNQVAPPLLVSFAFFMCVQLAGSKWKPRLAMNLWSLTVQCISFLILQISHPSLKTSNKTPTIYYLYWSTILATLVSLLTTLLCWALIRRRISAHMSPPTARWSKSLHGFLCGHPKEGQPPPVVTTGQQQTSSQKFDTALLSRRKEWKTLFVAIHSLVSLIITCLYLISIVTLMLLAIA